MIRIVAATCLVLCAGSAAAVDQPFIGQILVTPENFCPAGWEPMNGQLVAIADSDVLFQLIGTTFGGDGQTTFGLPTAKPIVTATGAPATQCISMFGIFPAKN